MAYPLRWPAGQPRKRRQAANFKVTMGVARDHLVNELKLLGARYVVVSTNVPTRLDGIPYASWRQPEDPAVAVYFDYDGEPMVFACDKWRKVEHNMRAIGKTIEALRGIARWGTTEMMKRAVSAFKALPADGSDWRAVLGFAHDAQPSWDTVKRTYRDLAATAHPDKGGSEIMMQRLNKAKEAAQKELS